MSRTYSKSSLFRSLLTWLALSIFLTIFAGQRAWSAAPEIRAVWMHPEEQFNADHQKGKAEVQQFVDRLAKANFNVIFPWIRSEYIAALTDRAYQKAVPIAKWDALGELIKAAKAKGLQVHLWYSFTYYKSPHSPEFNPALNGNPEWASVQIDELERDKGTGKVTPKRMKNLCPVHPEGRKWELALLEKVINRYSDLSGIHLEEPGYSGPGNCACNLCAKLFHDIYGFQGLPDVSGPQAEDLKCLGTTEFMRQLHTWLRKKHPKLLLSVNGGYSWRDDHVSGRDWKRWAELKWLDFYGPQVYTSDLEHFKNHTHTCISNFAKSCPVAVRIAVALRHGKNPVDTVLREVDIARQLGAQGVIFYHGMALTDEYLTALKSGPFCKPAPVLTHGGR
jgi:uncharacterized lipoprotein YddW (UPF0748 family)